MSLEPVTPYCQTLENTRREPSSECNPPRRGVTLQRHWWNHPSGIPRSLEEAIKMKTEHFHAWLGSLAPRASHGYLGARRATCLVATDAKTGVQFGEANWNNFEWLEKVLANCLDAGGKQVAGVGVWRCIFIRVAVWRPKCQLVWYMEEQHTWQTVFKIVWV